MVSSAGESVTAVEELLGMILEESLVVRGRGFAVMSEREDMRSSEEIILGGMDERMYEKKRMKKKKKRKMGGISYV